MSLLYGISDHDAVEFLLVYRVVCCHTEEKESYCPPYLQCLNFSLARSGDSTLSTLSGERALVYGSCRTIEVVKRHDAISTSCDVIIVIASFTF